MGELERLKARLEGEDYSDALLGDLLESAKNIILARRFPCTSWPDELEPQYKDLQIRIAVELFNRTGGEGQLAHSENGISRTWSGANVSPELLAEITPKAGVVRR